MPSRSILTSNAEPLHTGRPRDVIDELLAEALSATHPKVLVVLGLSAGLSAIVESSEAASVVAADRNVVHVRAAAESVRGMNHVTVAVSEGTGHLDPSLRAEVLAIRVPREKQPGLQLIWDAFQLLEPGGRLYLAGANRDGIKSYLQRAGELFGAAHTLTMRKGCRVGVAVRNESQPTRPTAFTSDLFDHHRYHTFDVEVRGTHYEVQSRPGVFSWDRLDGGTQALIETMELEPADRVLDLGCGYGIVGVVAGGMAPAGAVTMVDADIVAVESARRTVAANKLTNCEVLLDDGASNLESDTYDVVAVNPPFHLDRSNDYRTAERFITESARVLRPGGRLFLVANHFLPYQGRVYETFGNVKKAFEDRSYKVLSATKQVK